VDDINSPVKSQVEESKHARRSFLQGHNNMKMMTFLNSNFHSDYKANSFFQIQVHSAKDKRIENEDMV